MKRLYITLVTIAVALSSYAQNLTVLHLNDTHSHIDPERSGKYAGRGGVVEQAAYIDSVRLADGKDNVLLLHAGDFSQGTSYFTELNGDIEIDVLNAMERDTGISLNRLNADGGASANAFLMHFHTIWEDIVR